MYVYLCKLIWVKVRCSIWISEKGKGKSIPVTGLGGRAVAQAVSRWLPTAAARVRVPAACGFVVDKAALGQVFF
jgi:hypothetical protein